LGNRYKKIGSTNAMEFGTIIGEILKTQVHVVIGLLVLWAAIGLVGGIVLAVVVYQLLGRLGAWKLDWKHGKTLRVLSAVWLVLAFATCGAWIGGAQGVMFGVERVVRRSQFHDKILMPVGEVTADGLLFVDISLRNMDPETHKVAPLTEEQKELLQAFREGRAELNVNEFNERVAMLRDHVVDEAVEELNAQLKERTGLEAEGLAKSLLDWLLRGLVRHASNREAEEHLGQIMECYRTLPDAADDSGMISRTALAHHLVERGAVPAIMKPTRYVVRTTQIPWALGMAGSLIPPLLLFWLIRRFERKSGKADTARDDSPEDR
jgi:hypothetical protein